MTGIRELFEELTPTQWEQLAFEFHRVARELKARDHQLLCEFAPNRARGKRVARTKQAAALRERNRLRRDADREKYREQSRRYSAAYRARQREAANASGQAL